GDPLNGRPQLFPGDFPALGEVYRTTKNLAIGYRRVLSPRVVNSLTMGFSRFIFLFSQGEADKRFPNIPPFDFSGISEPYNNTPRTFRAVTTPQIVDNLNYVRGNHVFGFGANFRFYRHVDQRGQPGGTNVTPGITFSSSNRSPVACSSTVTTNCFAGLPVGFQAVSSANPNGRAGLSSTDNSFLLSSINNLLGIPAQITQRYLGNLTDDVFLPFKTGDKVTLWGEKHVLNQYNFYFQDEWKFRPNLTINYGLRWEINPAPSSPGFTYLPNGPIVGQPGPATPVVGAAGPVTFVKGKKWFQRDNLGVLGPRLGLAWSPAWKNHLMRTIFGDPGKSVVRMGYGIAFDPISSFQVTAVAGKVPGLVTFCSSTQTNTGALGTPTTGCTAAPNVRLGEGFPQLLPPPTLKPSTFLTPTLQTYNNAPQMTMFDPQLKLPTVHQWSLSWQRELPMGFVTQVAYIGRRGLRLLRSYDINQINGDAILPSFLALQQNVNRGCDPSGSNCPTGVSPVVVPFISSGPVAASVVNSSAARTEISQNAVGAFAERIENNTLLLNLRPNQAFNRITYIDSGGNSYYHALQVTLRRRFATGLGMNLAYTFGKSIDDGSIDPVGATSGGGLSTTTSRAPVDSRNFRLEHARSDFNRTHVLTIGSVWELPVGRGNRFMNVNNGALNQILGGWSINGIYTFMTGEPFSVTSGARTSNNAHVSRALIVDPSIRAQLQELPGQTFAGPVLFPSKDAFALPAPGSNGSGRNIFTAPSYWNLDLGFIKMFPLTERVKLQFRTEVFNALNHPNFDNPRDASAGSPSILSPLFAQTCCATVAPPSTQSIIQTGESARVIQFALKLQF
ncbi:MAG: TonB-dependent receptor, partial [Acidobacteriota bacterium]|nr:TonB-dependent receptor [Acidobacteriota bacterium]